MDDIITNVSESALKAYNKDFSASWTYGTNWTSVDTGFETFVNKYLFPKLNETVLQNVALGNRFDHLAKEVDFISQYSEEYVILDTIPVNMNLSQNAELMLKRNYPTMATKLYGQGVIKKTKFTLNNNDARHNFSILADATNYALGVYQKRISDINVIEEKEIKGTIVDYALNHAKDKRTVASFDELFTATYNALLNIQNNSEKYNEADTASGGEIGRYTTVSKLANIEIITTDEVKVALLDSKIANMFNVEGLDFSDRITSFDDLGGIWRVTEDVTITTQPTLNKFKAMGDYQVGMDSLVPAGSVITFDVSTLTEFVDKVEEIKPTSDLFAYIYDTNKLRYRRNTKGMLKDPFYNPEFDETTYWIHYPSFKSMSPFFNSVLITGA